MLVCKDGDVDVVIVGVVCKISVMYEFLYFVYVLMELFDVVVKLMLISCEIWVGDQFQMVDQGNVVKMVGLKLEQVKIYMLYVGGSFGWCVNVWLDYVVEVVLIVKVFGVDGKFVKL